MSLAVPTTAEVNATILAQIEASISQTAPLLPKAFVRVLAKVLAGTFILVYRYSAFTFLQLFVSTASMRETVVNGRTIRPLVEWGRLIGVGDPIAATRAELVINVVVQVQMGSLAAGSQLLYSSTGVVYATVASVFLNAPVVQVRIRAVSDQQGGGGAGAIGNLEVGAIVSFASPLPNIAQNATVVSVAVSGANAEADETYRTRVVRRFQRKPQGGAYADYRVWGEEVAGILNIYPYTGQPGQVDVYVEATVASSGSQDGIPTGAQLTAVANAIQLTSAGLASRRPANAAVNVAAITRKSLSVEVYDLDPDTAETRAAINSAVDEYMRSREPFIVGLSVLPRRDRITAANIAGVVDETAMARGATISEIKLKNGANPILAYTLGHGEKAKLNGAVAQYLS